MNNKIYKRSSLHASSPASVTKLARWHSLIALPLLLLPLQHSLAAIPAEWKNTAYAYEAEHKPLREVLDDFAQTFGTQLQIEGLLDGNVNGKIRANTPQSLLDRLGMEHRFQWYLYNNTLYISALDQQESARLEVSSETVADLKQALTDIGLLDNRFGWGELPEDGVVLVSGPKRYIEQIKQFSSQRRSAEEKQSVLTYPLKFANAGDRPIDYRGEKMIIPGVASMLRGLLEPRSASATAKATRAPSSGAAITSPMAQGLPRLGNPLLSQMLAPPSSEAQFNNGMSLTPRASVSAGRIRVEADVRNNAVMIYDLPERHGMYRDLIAQLDVARKLVEIDAIILDIERTQLREFGVNWGFQNANFRGGVNNIAPGSSSQLSIANRDGFFADVRALEQRGLATLVSNPSVLTLENQPAVIDFNRTQYLTAGNEVATILPITVGTSFQVVPRVITSRGSHQIIWRWTSKTATSMNPTLIASDRMYARARSARKPSWRKNARWWWAVSTSRKMPTSSTRSHCWATFPGWVKPCFRQPNAKAIAVSAFSLSPLASLVIRPTHRATCPRPIRQSCRPPSNLWPDAWPSMPPKSSTAT